MDAIKLRNSFDLLLFCSRFISGGNSLKEQRLVSRKRFLLAMCGISKFDSEALNLWLQSSSFCNAVKFLSTRDLIDLESLCTVNKMTLRGHHLAGKVRTFQNWVGPSLDKAIYVPPSHIDLEYLLDNFIVSLNSNKNNGLDAIIKIYSDLIKIHPFVDGNGRCSRVVWLSLLKRPTQCVPPFIYRLICSDPVSHDVAVRTYPEHINDYWNSMNQWGGKKTNEIITYIDLKMNELISLFSFFLLSEKLCNLISHLSNFPYVEINGDVEIFGYSLNDLKYEFSLLESIGFVSKRGLRAENKTFYECSFFYKMHIEMEDIIMCRRQS